MRYMAQTPEEQALDEIAFLEGQLDSARKKLKKIQEEIVPIGALFIDQDGVAYIAVNPLTHFQTSTRTTVLWRISRIPGFASKADWERKENREFTPMHRVLTDVSHGQTPGGTYMLAQTFINA